MILTEWLKRRRAKRRHEAVLRDCGCVCYCPNCSDILNDQAKCVDDIERELVYYECRTCGNHSVWTFDAAPVPILLQSEHQIGLIKTEPSVWDVVTGGGD